MNAAKKIFYVLSLVLLIAACGKKDENKTPPTITDFNQILQASDRTSLVGSPVDVDNVPVDTVVGTYVFWAGSARTGIPVFRADREKGHIKEHVKRGDKVRLTGTMRLIETLSSTDKLWENINEQEKQDIQNVKVFLSADQVQIIH
jgi:hypothetical protein